MSDKEERDKFYASTDWRKLRLHKLSMDPLCEVCKRAGRITIAVAVDHVIPIQDDPSQRLNYRNMQSICTPCHSSKTAREIWERANPQERDLLAEKLKHLIK